MNLKSFIESFPASQKIWKNVFFEIPTLKFKSSSRLELVHLSLKKIIP